jgi:hypothetical protein
VSGVVQSGITTGNNLFYNNYKAIYRPFFSGNKWSSLVPGYAESKKECKKLVSPGKACAYKSKIRKNRSLVNEPLQKASENLKTQNWVKYVQSF